MSAWDYVWIGMQTAPIFGFAVWLLGINEGWWYL